MTWQDEVRAVAAAAAAADGIAASDDLLRALGGPDGHILRWIAGALGGYAHVAPAHGEHPAVAEVVVAPGFRGRGLGTDLVAAALDQGGDGARVWAHGDLPAARAVAARLGLHSARDLLQLRRSLTDPALPSLHVPDGVVLRTYAGPQDDAELLRVNNAAFSWHPEQGGWTAADIEARRQEPWFDPDGLFLAAAPDGRLLGFHWTKVHYDEATPVGEVYVVAVDPVAHGRGLGAFLTLAGLHHLHARGLPEVLLYVEGDNTRALRTYDRLAFTRYRTDRAYARN